MPFESPFIKRLVGLALEEDLAYGDISTRLSVSDALTGTARVIARQQLIFCGGPIIAELFKVYGARAEIELRVGEGGEASDGDILAEVNAHVADLLMLERTILNFIQRLSGIATRTQHVVQSAAQGLVLLDTRKTTPGWRMLEKYAVQVGGGRNHRTALGDMILLKNNHIDANGGSVTATLKKVMPRKPFYMPVEVEVRNEQELKEALEFEIDVVMLDNFTDEKLPGALASIAERRPNVRVEVSGGLTAERLAALKNLGVTCVSMGALTTQATNVDISMRVIAD